MSVWEGKLGRHGMTWFLTDRIGRIRGFLHARGPIHLVCSPSLSADWPQKGCLRETHFTWQKLEFIAMLWDQLFVSWRWKITSAVLELSTPNSVLPTVHLNSIARQSKKIQLSEPLHVGYLCFHDLIPFVGKRKGVGLHVDDGVAGRSIDWMYQRPGGCFSYPHPSFDESCLQSWEESVYWLERSQLVDVARLFDSTLSRSSRIHPRIHCISQCSFERRVCFCYQTKAALASSCIFRGWRTS